MIKRLICLLVVCGLFSCSSLHRGTTADYNQKVKIVPGQLTNIGGDDGVLIKVLTINDNRCPKGVQCVWEGYVEVKFVMTGSKHGEASFKLCLGKCEVIGAAAKLNVDLEVKTYEVTLWEVGENQEVILSVRKI